MVMGSLNQETEVAIIGSGPGGYVAALRLADLGKEVTLIEERERYGGTCLLEGCIPSKALINAVELSEAAKKAKKIGLNFEKVTLDHVALRRWTESVVDGLANGVKGLLDRRGVEVVHGRARFSSSNTLVVDGAGTIQFQQCIIATGSSLSSLPPGMDSSVWSSADALKLPSVPQTLLVVGGGYIGLEMGLVYAGLGAKVSVVEFFPRLLLGADHDLVDIMVEQITPRMEEIMVESKVLGIAPRGASDRDAGGRGAGGLDDVPQGGSGQRAGFEVVIEHDGRQLTKHYEQVLVAIGRKPNTEDLGLENTRVSVNERGVIRTDQECRTDDPRIFAIGDVTDGPMLAHKASREGKVAAEVIAEHDASFDNRAIPAVVFTDPEIAWAGLTEREAEAQGIPVTVGRFPLAALGRARTLGRTDGLVKILCEPESGLVLGVGMVGPHVSELIAEGTLALEMGATLEDLMVTIHPHPTLSEAIMEAAEVAAGTAVHLPRAKRK